MFKAVQFPAGIANLDTALTNMDRETFTLIRSVNATLLHRRRHGLRTMVGENEKWQGDRRG